MPRFVSLEMTEFMEIVFACECLRSLEVLVTVEKNIYLQVLEFEIKEKGVDFFFIMGLLENILEYTRNFFFFLIFSPQTCFLILFLVIYCYSIAFHLLLTLHGGGKDWRLGAYMRGSE